MGKIITKKLFGIKCVSPVLCSSADYLGLTMSAPPNGSDYLFFFETGKF